MGSIVPGRIPQVRVKIGDSKQLFDPTSSSHAPTSPYILWAQEFGNAVKPLVAGTTEVFKEANCITLQHKEQVENTRLPVTYDAIDSITNATVKKTGKDTSLNSLETDYTARYSPSNSSTFAFRPLSGAVDLRLVSSNGRPLQWSTPSNAKWFEVAPNKDPQTVRICQDTTAAWPVGALISDFAHIKCPNFVIEVDKAAYSLSQSKNANLSGSGVWMDTRAVASDVTKLNVQRPFFTVTLAYGTNDAVTFVFADGAPPAAIRNSDGALSVAPTSLVTTIPQKGAFKVTGRYNLTYGTYEITSDLFSGNTWHVGFKKVTNSVDSNGKTILGLSTFAPLVVPAGNIAFHFCGLGAFTFAYGPVRFEKTAKLQVTYNLEDTSGSNRYADSETGKIPNQIFQRLPEETGITSITYDGKTQDPATGACIYWVNVATTDDRYTPFIYGNRVNANQLPNHSTVPTTEEETRIAKIDLEPAMNGGWRVGYSGSITFYNNLDPETMESPWQNAPILQAIIIEFKYYDEDTWSTIFTGFLIKPDQKRVSYQQKTITFALADRWYPFNYARMFNSPFYDGTSWLNCFCELCAKAGYTIDDMMLVGDTQSQSLRSYTLPAAPNWFINPQFKFKFGSTVMSCIEQIQQLVRYFLYMDFEGKLFLVSALALANFEHLTFYASSEDAPDGDGTEKYNILTSYNYTLDTDSVRNVAYAAGMNYTSYYSPLQPIPPMTHAAVQNSKSINDPTYEGYLGFESFTYFSHSWLATDALCRYFARELLTRTCRPIKEITWTVPYFKNNYQILTKVRFKDPRGVIPEDEDFFLVGASFHYDSSSLKLTSQLKAKSMRSLVGGLIAGGM